MRAKREEIQEGREDGSKGVRNGEEKKKEKRCKHEPLSHSTRKRTTGEIVVRGPSKTDWGEKGKRGGFFGKGR